MTRLVALNDAGEDPVYINPALVTHVARPALEMFGHTVVHFVGGESVTVKQPPETVVKTLLGAGAEAVPPVAAPAPAAP